MLSSDLIQIAQFEALRSWLTSLTDNDLESDSVLPGWQVRHLIAHLATALASAEQLVAVQGTTTEVVTVGEFLAAGPAAADRLSTSALDAADKNPDVRAFLVEGQQRAVQRWNELGGSDRMVSTPSAIMPLSAYFDTRLIETVVHTLDLAASVPEVHPPTIFRPALDRVVLLLREILTERASDPVAALSAASALPAVPFILAVTGRAGEDLDPALVAAGPLV